MAPCVFLCESATARERRGLPTLREEMSISDSSQRKVLPAKAKSSTAKMYFLLFPLCLPTIEFRSTGWGRAGRA